MTAREDSIASKRKPAIPSALGFEQKEVLVLMNPKSYQITISALQKLLIWLLHEEGNILKSIKGWIIVAISM